ncbi:MAG: hypothetical protein L0220_27870 [Acidobacteria bacterium]|nr:hypothetical protein [Acidobacteriota bacterium]
MTGSRAAAEAKYNLECIIYDEGGWHLFAGDKMIAPLDRNNSELSVQWGKLIFAWWDDDHSQNWRVTAFEIDESSIYLQVTRGLARNTSTLTLRNSSSWEKLPEFNGLMLPERRKLFLRLLARTLIARFDDLTILRATKGADRSRSVPGKYARLTIRKKGEIILVIGASSAEIPANIEGVAAAGLIWLAGFNRDKDPKLQARQLWFCLPPENSRTVSERLSLIDAGRLEARIACFEFDERREEIISLSLATQYELFNTNTRQMMWPIEHGEHVHLRRRILSLAPGSIEVRQRAGDEGECYAINGLEFACLSAGETVKFGVAGCTSKTGVLDQSNFNALANLVKEILLYRSVSTPDPDHSYYRLRPEAWLESLLRRNIHALDGRLNQAYIYSQIPSWRGAQRSVLDLLTINDENRLVVIEIKVAEDAQLPIQGLDYWLCIEQARLLGEFERRGLFPGIGIANRPPLLYLVAPQLRFHRTFTELARLLSPQIEAYRIGVNANWRMGVRVHSSERVN